MTDSDLVNVVFSSNTGACLGPSSLSSQYPPVALCPPTQHTACLRRHTLQDTLMKLHTILGFSEDSKLNTQKWSYSGGCMVSQCTLRRCFTDNIVRGTHTSLISISPCSYPVCTLKKYFCSFNIVYDRSKTRRTKPTSIILCLIILALFTSTTIYLVVYILYIQYDDAISTVASHASPVDLNKFTQEDVDNIILKYHSLYNCAGTSALTINVWLSD